MKINWKLRLQNKTSLTAIILAIVAIIYKVLGLFGIAPAISQDSIIEVVELVIFLLCLLGIVVDPTTNGVSDSTRAMTYNKPYKSEGH